MKQPDNSGQPTEPSARPLVIGVDIGTTNLKAGVFSLDGACLAQAEVTVPLLRPAAGRAEQDPGGWWRALRQLLSVTVQALPERASVAGIGLCGQVNSHVFVAADGQPVAPAVAWQDERTTAALERLQKRIDKCRALLPPGYVSDAASTLARAEWAAEEAPGLWARTQFVLAPKDFLNLCLTGRAASDAASSIGLVDAQGRYLDAVVALVGGLAERLPRLFDFRSALGVVRPLGEPRLDRVLRGARCAVGSIDAIGNLYGSGLAGAGTRAFGLDVAGTCEIVGALSTRTAAQPGVVAFPIIDGLSLHAGPTTASGAALAWFAGLHELGIDALVACAASAEPGSGGLVFLPYLDGERAPLWDRAARGVFLGLTTSHGRAEMCRAVMEGVAFSARHVLEAVEKSTGSSVECLRLSGGGARSTFACQLRADVSGRPVEVLTQRHSGVAGAAAVAAAAAGLGELASLSGRFAGVRARYEPEPAQGLRYDALYALYRALYPALRPAFQQLSRYREGVAAVALQS